MKNQKAVGKNFHPFGKNPILGGGEPEAIGHLSFIINT